MFTRVEIHAPVDVHARVNSAAAGRRSLDVGHLVPHLQFGDERATEAEMREIRGDALAEVREQLMPDATRHETEGSVDPVPPQSTRGAPGPETAAPARPAWPERPTHPRPTEGAYRYALDLVRYEGGDLDAASPATRDTIRRWRAWQTYDAARAKAPDEKEPEPAPLARSATATEADGDALVVLPHGPLADPDWVVVIDDLLPCLYRHWRPISVAHAGHPRRGTPHLANADGTRLSTHVALWAERHGHRYSWARRLLRKAEQAGLIRSEIHRIEARRGVGARSWSQWVPLEPDAYRRRLAELLPSLERR
jgi:hypothetical protein